MSFVISVPDVLRQSVEAATGGRVTVLYDDKGYPSYMVRIPRFNIEDVIADGSAGTGTHPAFIVNGTEHSELLIGQHQASVHDGRAISLPGRDPKVYTDFDEALGYCSAKGSGWHLMTNAEWAALALWCWEAGLMPTGNTDHGRNHDLTYQVGTRQDGDTYAPGESSGDARILTGSGPAAWRHDGTIAGIADLCGNIWEWTGGLRLQDGEIQVVPDNDAADNSVDQSASSGAWQGIQADGSGYAAPGTTGNLHYDTDGSGTIELDTALDNPDTSTGMPFEDMAIDGGISAPNKAKVLGLYPAGSGLEGDKSYMNNSGERLARRGGDWAYGSEAGVFTLYLYTERSGSSVSVGFRPCYVAL